VVFVGIEVSISMARPLPLARDLREHHDWRGFLDHLKRLSGSSEVPLVELTAFILHIFEKEKVRVKLAIGS
jgi:hypothetical protein